MSDNGHQISLVLNSTEYILKSDIIVLLLFINIYKVRNYILGNYLNITKICIFQLVSVQGVHEKKFKGLSIKVITKPNLQNVTFLLKFISV